MNTYDRHQQTLKDLEALRDPCPSTLALFLYACIGTVAVSIACIVCFSI